MRLLTLHSGDARRRSRWRKLAAPGAAVQLTRGGYQPGDQYPWHDHDYHELFWVERGTLVHATRAGETTLAPGDLVLLHPRCRHSLRARSSACIYVKVAVPSAPVRRLLRAYRRDGAAWGTPDAPLVRRLDAVALAECAAWAERLDARLSSPLERDAFLLHLLRLLRPVAAAAPPAWIAEALASLDRPERLALGVRGLAIAAGRSREHLARELRRHLGRTPQDVIDERRLAWVAARLRAGDGPVARLCAACRAGNRTRFNAAFAARFGALPGAYARRRR